MIGSVSIDLRQGTMLLRSESRTVDGIYVLNGWFREFPVGTPETTLGQAVLEGLGQTADKQPRLNRQEIADRLNQMLQKAGVRSYATYLRGTRGISIMIREPGKLMTFIPTHNGGPTGRDRGFTPVTDLEFTVPIGSSAEAVGAATVEALAAATLAQ